ncbi:ZCHC3 protein, partial [Polyodon spathula]|nr:ZCHC3 protein [Polyodon spathula]
VRMSSPQVPEEEIRSFIERFFTVKHGLVKEMDSAGIWTNWRKFYGRFNMGKKSGTHAGLKPVFYIGPNRGIIRYAGQPNVCYKCAAADHYAAECTETVCRNCGEVGHVSRECGEGKKCNLCGAADHLYKDC